MRGCVVAKVLCLQLGSAQTLQTLSTSLTLTQVQIMLRQPLVYLSHAATWIESLRRFGRANNFITRAYILPSFRGSITDSSMDHAPTFRYHLPVLAKGGCFHLHTSPGLELEVKQPDTRVDSSSPQRHQVSQNALDAISQGSSLTVRQWIFARYAILTTLQHSALMDMLVRRHEIAMACIARRILDASSQEANHSLCYTGSETEQYPSRASTKEPSSSTASTAHYAVQPGETFKNWLHRLRRELPQARSSKRMHVVASDSSDEIDVVFEPVPSQSELDRGRHHSRKLLGKSLEPRTKRVLYEEGLPYTQFVAALGTQLLLPLQRWVRRAAQSDSQPRRQLSQALLVESLLAIEAHGVAPLLLQDSKTRSPTRNEVEELVQEAIRSRGVDYSFDPDQQLRLAMLAQQIARQKTKKS